jgi:hypothetical protein
MFLVKNRFVTFLVFEIVLLLVDTLGLAAQIKACGFIETKVTNPARMTSADQTIFIPVVFHIVQNGIRGTVSDQQVYEQLEILNADFTRSNLDSAATLSIFKAIAGNPNIKFFIAENHSAVGIIRSITTHGPFANDDLHLSIKGGQDSWDGRFYLNVWVADLAPAVLGYGSAPGEKNFKDGVAIHYENFGKTNAKIPYDFGRTLTHEVGHWLGLAHPWGDGGCESDDGVDDTPPQFGPTYGCDLNSISCGSLTMVQNFMNTSFDACMNFFTKGQAELMRETLFNFRPDIIFEEPVTTSVQNDPSQEILIFPNPATSPVVFLKLPESADDFHVSIAGELGINILNISLSGGIQSLDIHQFPNGQYIVSVQSMRYTAIKKLVLNLQ